MVTDTRIIFKNNTVFTDLSDSLSDYLGSGSTIDYVTAQDAIYIGSEHPFNHYWFEMGEINLNASSVSLALWDGSAWRNSVDNINNTAASGVPLTQSGLLSFVPDRYQTWTHIETTEWIPELISLRIYDKYWAKLLFNRDLTSTTQIKFMGHKFCSENDLVNEYPDFLLQRFKSAYKDGKLTWDDQIFAASEYIIQDLKSANIIWSRGQVLDPNVFKKACIHRTAAIILQAMGDDYGDSLKTAYRSYKDSMDLKYFRVDGDQNGRLSRHEKHETVGYLKR